MVDVFKQARDGICRAAVGLGHVPQDIGGGQAVALHGEAEAHPGRVKSRRDACASGRKGVVSFYMVGLQAGDRLAASRFWTSVGVW